MATEVRESKSKHWLQRLAIPASLCLFFLWAIVLPESFWSGTARLCLALNQPEWAASLAGQISNPSQSSELLIARIDFSRGHYAKVVDRFLRVGPETPNDMRILGTSLAKIGRWTEALPVLEHAHASGVENPDLLCELADAYGYLGLYEQAMETTGAIAKLPGYKPHALYRLGTLNREQGNYEEFIKDWLELTRVSHVESILDLDWNQIRLELAEICAASGKYQEAEELISRVANTGRKYFIQGQIESGRGERTAAEESWRKAIELEPQVVSPRVELARLLFAANMPEDAMDVLKPLEIRGDTLPTDVCHLFQLIYTKLDEDDRALEWQELRSRAQKRNERLHTLSRLSTAGNSVTSRVIRAWKFASAGNPLQAMMILEPIEAAVNTNAPASEEANFVKRLANAIREKRPLPDLLEFIKDVENDSAIEQ